MLQLPKLLQTTTRIQDESLRRRASVLNILFAATFGILIISALAICAVYLTGFNRLVLHRLLAVVLAISVVAALYVCLRRRRYFIAASGLLGIYWALATIMALTWGIALPLALILYCTLIVLSGIVLGATYSIITLCTSSIVIFIIQLATVRGSIHPNYYWQTEPQHLTDLVGYYFVFTILGVSSWLFNRQTDQSLHRALRAESALQREKELLELKVEQRTRELQAAQIDKMQQMYRFTQLGQFSTSLLHDLGNHMTTLSLDIDGMSEQKTYQSQLQKRIKGRITYVDNMVRWAYAHINGTVTPKHFKLASETREITNILQYDARAANVRLHGMPKNVSGLTLYGDPARYRQMIANLITNAIDAYDKGASANEREVTITAEQAKDAVRITVSDHGKGIPPEIQKKIFDPFYTTKDKGTGIGLFVVKQIVEEYFHGKIALSSKPGQTSFTVTLYAAHDNA
jgi:signal transduction histidine kinase